MQMKQMCPMEPSLMTPLQLMTRTLQLSVASKCGQCLLSGKTKVFLMLPTLAHHLKSLQILADCQASVTKLQHQAPLTVNLKQLNPVQETQTVTGYNLGLLVLLAQRLLLARNRASLIMHQQRINPNLSQKWSP